eukprot:scaffold97908_cov36-Phaeocystis_antarctica.AAC.1
MAALLGHVGSSRRGPGDYLQESDAADGAAARFDTGLGIVLARSFALELQNAGAATAAVTAPATAATTATAAAASDSRA